MGDRVGDQRLHDRRSIGPRRPLEGRGHAILEPVPAVGEPGGVAGRQLETESVEPARQGTTHEQATGQPQAQRPEKLSQQERKKRRERTDEQPAKPIILRSPSANLPHDIRDQPLQYRRVRHRRPR